MEERITKAIMFYFDNLGFLVVKKSDNSVTGYTKPREITKREATEIAKLILKKDFDHEK